MTWLLQKTTTWFQHIERPVVNGVSASWPSGISDSTTSDSTTSDEATTKTIVPDSAARTVSIRTFNGLAQVILQKK